MQKIQVLNLLDHHHKFPVEEVIIQYKLWCKESDLELDPSTGIEAETSKQLRFEAYNDYEFDDFCLSRMVVKSLLSSALMECITTKYRNNKTFETYPGQVLFTIVLDTCNISVYCGILCAQKHFEDLTLDSFPVEDVTELAIEASRPIYLSKHFVN